MLSAPKSEVAEWYNVSDRTLSNWVDLLYSVKNDAPFEKEIYKSFRVLPPVYVGWIVKNLGVTSVLILKHPELTPLIASYYEIDLLA